MPYYECGSSKGLSKRDEMLAYARMGDYLITFVLCASIIGIPIYIALKKARDERMRKIQEDYERAKKRILSEKK